MRCGAHHVSIGFKKQWKARQAAANLTSRDYPCVFSGMDGNLNILATPLPLVYLIETRRVGSGAPRFSE